MARVTHKGGAVRFQRRARAERILELYMAGLNCAEIARRVGCSRVNAFNVVRYYVKWNHRVAPLPDAQREWMLREAEKIGAKPEVMARALLVDAINEAMEKSE